MEIRIVNDGLRYRDGSPLHTYEYSFASDEVIDVYHLPPGETICWECATKENMSIMEKREKKKQENTGLSVVPWVDLEIEAFIVCMVDKQGKSIL